MNRIGLSEGQRMLKACRAALPKPDPDENPILNRPKDPYLVLLFGVNYDTSLVYVNIAPRALALELLSSKSPILGTLEKRQRQNEFFTPEDQPNPEDSHLARKVFPVSWDDFLILHKRLGVTRYTGPLEFEWNGLYDHRDPDIQTLDDETSESFGLGSERISMTTSGTKIVKMIEAGAPNGNRPIEPARESSNELDIDANRYRSGGIGKGEDYNANYDDGSSSDSDYEYNTWEDPRTYPEDPYFFHYRPNRRHVRGPKPVPIPYGVHNPAPQIEETFPSHFQKLIDSLDSEIRTHLSKIDWSVDNPLKFPDRKTADPWNVAIHDFHAKRLQIWSKRMKPNIFTSRPTFIALNFGSKFDRYDPRLWVLEDDAPEPGDDPFEFAQIGQNSLQYLLDVIRIQWNNLNPIDIYYINDPILASSSSSSDSSDSPHPPKQPRLKIPIQHTFDHMGPPHRAVLTLGLRLFMEDLNIEKLEPDFSELTKYAIFKYITSTPSDDIQMRESLLVLWELTKVITCFTDLIRELQFCYAIMPCHGTLEDHVNLFLKAIWGPSTIVPGTKENESFNTIRQLVTRYIRGRDCDHTGLEMKLMKLVLHRDMVIRNERRKWRGENRDAVMRSICEDGGTSYVSDQAAKLLNPNKRVESRKRDADEVLYRLGWEKKPGNWGSVRYKAHEPLHTQVLRLMSEQHGEKGGKGATNRNKGELVQKGKEKENTEVVKRVQTVFEVKLLHGADKVEDGEEESKAKKEGKGKSVTRRIGVGILRFMKIKK
ncbi:hypothetical protein TWF128_010752 [Orbilia oligospora]|nr:hypothetical protein TWF128_010752 [Orbilia oligospora]